MQDPWADLLGMIYSTCCDRSHFGTCERSKLQREKNDHDGVLLFIRTRMRRASAGRWKVEGGRWKVEGARWTRCCCIPRGFKSLIIIIISRVSCYLFDVAAIRSPPPLCAWRVVHCACCILNCCQLPVPKEVLILIFRPVIRLHMHDIDIDILRRWISEYGN